jgi:hypothetical protein
MLPGGKEISLDYTFRPDRLLGGRDFQLALTVFYEDTKGGFFSTTFFNSTVDFTEIKKLVDTEAIFLYLLMAGAIAVAGMLSFGRPSDPPSAHATTFAPCERRH